MLTNMRSWWLSAVVSIAAVCAQPVRAQCGPDGLNGPCCVPVTVNLPNFPQITQDMRWLCFDNCAPTVNNLHCVQIGTPIPITQGGGIVCGEYRIRFVIRNCGALPVLWNGLTKAHYARTWIETPVAGTQLQVWRFLINGDFGPTTSVPNTPCTIPGCSAAYSRYYFTGYIDYALDCATNQWQVAFGLTHECDGIHHTAASVRPAPAAGFHPTRSFTMVSPGATFAVATGAVAQSDGPIVQGSMRWNDWATSPVICRTEEQTGGNVIAGNQFCMCVPAALPQYITTTVIANSTCGSSINPSPLGPMLQKRIGGWNVAAVFPGNEFLLFDLGYLNHVNGCNGVASLEWFEGVETIGGYQANDLTGVLLGRQFEDWESANRSPTSAATQIGAPHVPYYLVNLNLP